MIIVADRGNNGVEGLLLHIQFLQTVSGMFLLKSHPGIFHRFHSFGAQEAAVRQADNLLARGKQTYSFFKQHIEIRLRSEARNVRHSVKQLLIGILNARNHHRYLIRQRIAAMG